MNSEIVIGRREAQMRWLHQLNSMKQNQSQSIASRNAFEEWDQTRMLLTDVKYLPSRIQMNILMVMINSTKCSLANTWNWNILGSHRQKDITLPEEQKNKNRTKQNIENVTANTHEQYDTTVHTILFLDALCCAVLSSMTSYGVKMNYFLFILFSSGIPIIFLWTFPTCTSNASSERLYIIPDAIKVRLLSFAEEMGWHHDGTMSTKSCHKKPKYPWIEMLIRTPCDDAMPITIPDIHNWIFNIANLPWNDVMNASLYMYIYSKY